MKVLVWAENFLPFVGGAEILLSHLLPALAERGVRLEVITSRSSGRQPDVESWKGIRIHRHDFRKAMMGDLRAFTELRNRLSSIYRNFQPDLIHAHTTGPSLFLEWQMHREFKAPRLLTVHGFFSYPPDTNGYLRKYLSGVRYLTGVSERVTELALALFAGSLPPHRTVYNGLPSSASLPEGREADATGLLLSRLSREKGIDLALRALYSLRDRWPHMKLRIAGAGPERESLEALVKALELQDRVQFLGLLPPDRVDQAIADCGFLVVPSRVEEGFGLAALQAAFQCKPAIAARLGGLPEVVREEETGLLFDAEDWQGLGKMMERLLASPELRRKLGNQAREFAKTQFDFIAMTDAYECIYRQLALGIPAHPVLE